MSKTTLFCTLILGFSLLVAGLLDSQSPSTGTTGTTIAVHPRDYVEISVGNPFTVPTGKIFVLTALGRSVTSPSTGTSTITINGVQKGVIYTSINLPHEPSVQPWPVSIFAVAGDVVDTPSNGGIGFGYLVDE